MRLRSTCVEGCVNNWFLGHVQLRILTPVLDWKRWSSSQSSPFSVISFIFTRCSAVCGCSLQLVILWKISSIFYCLLYAVSQSVLFLGRLFTFECCRVCPWTSLRSSRLDTRCSSCQRCCEHFQLSSECLVSKELVDPNEGGCVSK